jgi:hypothetical protein
VPGELSEDVFWTHYFFRVHQINQEDEQRKAVLSGKVPISVRVSKVTMLTAWHL